jgi:hypothetical protein
LKTNLETARLKYIGFAWLLLSFATSCRQSMANQPKYLPLDESTFFSDGRSARPIPAGTVDRTYEPGEAIFYTGMDNGEPTTVFPIPVTRPVLERGRERFNIYCSPCHGKTGDGQGIVIQRGFRKPPPTYHMDRLRQAPVGYLFDVITNGFGEMKDYSAEIHPRDRWAIVAYVRALQLSQNASLNDIPPDERRELERQQ